MATQAQQHTIYSKLLRKHGRLVATAFRRVVRDIANTVSVKELVDAIGDQDFDRVARLVGMTESRLFPLAEAVRSTYVAGGASVGVMEAVTFAFDGRHSRAERWLSLHTAELVQGAVEESRQMLRDVILAGVEDGRSTNAVAREIIGYGRTRTGGALGLTKEQAAWVRSTRRQLQDLDPAYLKKKLRDRRFDATVKRALDSGKPLTAKQVNQITARYAEKTEAFRARNVARYEARQGITNGQAEGYWQLKEDPDVEDVLVRWQYNSVGQESREDHQAAAMEKPHSLGQPWYMEKGVKMMHPHDPAGGPEQNMHCHCTPIWRVVLRG